MNGSAALLQQALGQPRRGMHNDRGRGRGGGRGSNMSAAAAQSIETGIRRFLLSRYNAQAMYLNLDNIAQDPILNEFDIHPPWAPRSTAGFAATLWRVAEQHVAATVTLSLANNGLSSVQPLNPGAMVKALPNVRNLSLADNHLTRFMDLNSLSATSDSNAGSRNRHSRPDKTGWLNLTELLMTGNPVTNEKKYRYEIGRKFPNLTQLDMTPIDPSGNAALNAAIDSNGGRLRPGPGPSSQRQKLPNPPQARRPLGSAIGQDHGPGAHPQIQIPFPLQIAPSFYDSPDVQAVVSQFLMRFFQAYDSARSSLQYVYQNPCSFSYVADTTIPPRGPNTAAGTPAHALWPNQSTLNWRPYIDGSRNFTRIRNQARRDKISYSTPSAVIHALMSLPVTTHALDDPSAFVVDAWTIPSLLKPSSAVQPVNRPAIFCTVHGRFSESPSRGVRAFDRAFILAPAEPGSPAQLNGWPCEIASDLLTVRGLSDPATFAPGSLFVGPGPAHAQVPQAAPQVHVSPAGTSPVPVAPGAQQDPVLAGLSPDQASLVVQMQQASNLTLQYARMCLEQNQWSPQVAWAQFSQLKSVNAIPPEAFLV